MLWGIPLISGCCRPKAVVAAAAVLVMPPLLLIGGAENRDRPPLKRLKLP